MTQVELPPVQEEGEAVPETALDAQAGAKAEPDAAEQQLAKTSGALWKKAGKGIVMANKFSDRLTTLRDLMDSSTYVDSHQLKLVRQLGAGAFATVSLCEYTPAGGSGATRQVAVKQMRTELLDDPAEVKTFVKEVELLRKLRHKYIVEFYGCGWSKEADASAQREAAGGAGPADQQLFFLQEVMEGGSLQQMVLKAMTSQAALKVYSDADALRWALQIANALEYLHSRKPKVLHRDLKLENVLLTGGKPGATTAKLADFGLARMLTSGGAKGREKEKRLNKLASIPPQQRAPSDQQRSEALQKQLSKWMSRKVSESESKKARELTARTGSLGYMAPEVLQGLQYDEKADVFSFAIICYNVFSRNIPTLHIVLNGTLEDLELYACNVAHGYRPELTKPIPEGVQALIERCWKGLPELRPSIAEVVAELERLQAQMPAAQPAGAAAGNQAIGAGSASAKTCCCIS